MPAYKYEFGLFEILTTGVGSSAYWRIQDEALKKTGMWNLHSFQGSKGCSGN
jgi:hypothetical protein